MTNSPESMDNQGTPDGFLHTYGLEFFAADHCVFKCSGCSQCSPYLDEYFADVAVFEKSVKVLGQYLRPDKITIVGGEPLLHPEIDSIIEIAERSGMFQKIHITTNAVNLMNMSRDFWKKIDVLAISKYPANADFIDAGMDEIKAKCAANQVELQIREMGVFNHIVLSEENASREMVNEIYGKCIYKYYCHTLSEGRIFRCSPAVNFKKYQEKLGNKQFNNSNDYLMVEDSDNFKMDLFKYLDAGFPLESCNYCLGSSGKPFPHRQLTTAEIENPSRTGISDLNYDNYR